MAPSRAQAPPRYAVLFSVLGEPPLAGSLTVASDRLLLEGGTASSPATLSIGFAELREIRIGRAPSERLNSHAALVLDRSDAPSVCVAPLGPGLLHEIADLITGFTAAPTPAADRLAVVVPIKPGTHARITELVAEGPPLDPAELGLHEHLVGLHPDRVVFVFGGPNVREKIERAAHRPTLWRAGLAWRSCIAGAPRVTAVDSTLEGAELIYSWRAAD